MGSSFVFLTYVIFGSLLAAAASAMLVRLVGQLTHGVPAGADRVIHFAKVLPWAWLVWALAWVQIYGEYSLANGRDAGYGDEWRTPISDSYDILMIDEPRVAWLYPHACGADGVVHCGGKEISNVLRLEVRPPWLFGSIAEGSSFEPGPESSYFVLDMTSGVKKDFSSLAEVEAEALRHGSPLRLASVGWIHAHFRPGPYDRVLSGIERAPEILALVYLILTVVKLRATRTPSAAE